MPDMDDDTVIRIVDVDIIPPYPPAPSGARQKRSAVWIILVALVAVIAGSVIWSSLETTKAEVAEVKSRAENDDWCAGLKPGTSELGSWYCKTYLPAYRKLDQRLDRLEKPVASGSPQHGRDDINILWIVVFALVIAQIVTATVLVRMRRAP